MNKIVLQPSALVFDSIKKILVICVKFLLGHTILTELPSEITCSLLEINITHENGRL